MDTPRRPCTPRGELIGLSRALAELGGLEFPVRRSENARCSIGNANHDLNGGGTSMWECVRYLGHKRQSCHP